jgi:hypothetical protein
MYLIDTLVLLMVMLCGTSGGEHLHPSAPCTETMNRVVKEAKKK